MKQEHNCLSTDNWPAPSDLDNVCRDGWRVLQIIKRRPGEILTYLVREIEEFRPAECPDCDLGVIKENGAMIGLCPTCQGEPS